jgi:hypothetical protein
MIRGLLLVEIICPKLPGLRIRPLASRLPPEELTAFRLLIGFARFGWLNTLKNSVRSSTRPDSARRKLLMTAKSRFDYGGPVRQLRGTFPMSVPFPPAIAVPPELGIGWPPNTTGDLCSDNGRSSLVPDRTRQPPACLCLDAQAER